MRKILGGQLKKSKMKFIIRAYKYTKNHVCNNLKQFGVYLIKPLFAKKYSNCNQIWLIGAHLGKLYTDNSSELHKYIIRNFPEINIYWVIDKNSADLEKVKKIGPVIIKNSLNNYIYASISSVYIVSHSLTDIGLFNSPICKDIFKVRLGHGFTALKKKRDFGNDINLKSVYDLFVFNSDFEKGIISKGWKINESKIAVTGMPRYDNLLNEIKMNEKKRNSILYMPTWRDWLNGTTKTEFIKSVFFEGFKGLLLDEGFQYLLKKENLELNVYIHLNMREYMRIFNKEFNLERVKFLNEEENLQNVIVNSDILITDYSSTAWDFMFSDKKVVFYRPDIEEYEKGRGSYIQLRDKTFGPVTERPDEVADILRKLLFDEGKKFPIAKENDKQLFKYRDNNNCKRVMDEIFCRIEKNSDKN